MAPSPEPQDTFGELYTVETLVQITHISRNRITVYQEHGLITPVETRDEPRFDDSAILRLQRISTLLTEYGVNDQGLKAFFSLLDEVERLREELRFRRG